MALWWGSVHGREVDHLLHLPPASMSGGRLYRGGEVGDVGGVLSPLPFRSRRGG